MILKVITIFWRRLIYLTIIFQFSCFIALPLFSQDAIETVEDYSIVKGRKYSNISFSLDQRDAENEDQLFRQVINQNKFNYRITASGGYALKDNFTVGLGVSYGREFEDVTFLNQDDEEVLTKSLGQDITFIPNIRKYIPLGKTKFQIFVQTDLRISFGEYLQRDFFIDEIDKIEEDFVQVRLGVQPGVVMFFSRNWTFETSVGIVGLSSKWSTKTINNDEANKTKVQESSIDLKLNLLSLNLGVAFYL